MTGSFATRAAARFARVAECQDEEPGAPVLARLRMADHWTIAVVDLSFLAGRGGDHDAGLGRGDPAAHHDEAAHAGISGVEAVVDEVCQMAMALRPRRSASMTNS